MVKGGVEGGGAVACGSGGSDVGGGGGVVCGLYWRMDNEWIVFYLTDQNVSTSYADTKINSEFQCHATQQA